MADILAKPAVTIFPVDPEGDEFEIPATVRTTHSTTIRKTSYPVEDGVDITDHARIIPDTLDLECVIPESDSLVGGGITSKLWRKHIKGEDRLYHEAVYDWLDNAAREKVVWDIVTPLKVYVSMMLVGISAPRTVATANSLNVTLSFSAVEYASPDITELESPEEPDAETADSAEKNKNNGTKKKKDVTAEEAKGAEQAGDDWATQLGITDALGL